MRRYLTALALCGLVLATTVAAAPSSAFDNLDPGGRASLRENVPVNFVFVGYEPGQVDQNEFLSGLPSTYKPVVRSRLFYGITEFLGLDYTYEYDVTYASSDYEDAFFGRLGDLARPAPLTEFQVAYNQQKSNVRVVRNNHLIDAPTVEKWLAQHPPQGVDTTEDTLYFVNWFGRDDFVHHLYTKTNEPDPDTGHNFGTQNENRKIIAWGGTTAHDEENGLGETRRVWFYDLSAGPEAWTDNWNVDNPDLPEIDDNSIPDYRMPPIWEYTAGGFRSPGKLTSDLALVARYVGIDLLFTTSPYYPPDITPPVVPQEIDLDTTTYEGWPGVDASQRYVTRGLLLDELGELQPLSDFSHDNEDEALTGRARHCYVRWIADRVCFPRRAYPAFANLYIYNALRTPARRDDVGRVDYEAPLVNYSTGPELPEPFLLGFADDDYRTGSQSIVFSFVSPGIVEAGYGLTTTMIHEVGHHVGLSHPHDGFDYETGVDFGPADRFYFAWSGSESNSMMSYIDLNWDFSQFDEDNMNRFLTAAFINNANAIAADVLKADAGAGDDLEAADEAIGAASEALAAHDYLGASRHAQRAYEVVRAAAVAAGVPVVGDDSAIEVTPPAPGVGARDERPFTDYIGRRGHRAFQ